MQVYDSFKNGGAEISWYQLWGPQDEALRGPAYWMSWEKVTLCAFDGQPTATRVAYLDCMDTPWSHLLNWTDPKRCAEQVGIPLMEFQSASMGHVRAALERGCRDLYGPIPQARLSSSGCRERKSS